MWVGISIIDRRPRRLRDLFQAKIAALFRHSGYAWDLRKCAGICNQYSVSPFGTNYFFDIILLYNCHKNITGFSIILSRYFQISEAAKAKASGTPSAPLSIARSIGQDEFQRCRKRDVEPSCRRVAACHDARHRHRAVAPWRMPAQAHALAIFYAQRDGTSAFSVENAVNYLRFLKFVPNINACKNVSL